MSRTADSTIKGFLYQFNKTLLSIINSEDEETVTVEGLIEDVDVISDNGDVKAIQCKYHESQAKYTDSLIFKPLLQMAETYSKNNPQEISFTIYLHVPAEAPCVKQLEMETLNSALATTNQSLLKIIERIDPNLDRKKFLSKVNIEFGLSIDELEIAVKQGLSKLKLVVTDVECVLYPNAISKIAKLSSLKKEEERKITRKYLVNYLSSVTTTAITKWTLSLKNRKAILDTSRKQLAGSLNQNSRERYFYFSQQDIAGFDDDVVVFISNYLSKYHSKPTHLKTPFFAINTTNEGIKTLTHRLYKKGIRTNLGLIADHFELEEFYREPIQKTVRSKISEREFELRLLALDSQPEAINYRKCEDFYLICDTIPECIDTRDTNIYQIGTNNFKELEFVMNLRGTYE